jgi:hypothetical protein
MQIVSTWEIVTNIINWVHGWVRKRINLEMLIITQLQKSLSNRFLKTKMIRIYKTIILSVVFMGVKHGLLH